MRDTGHLSTLQHGIYTLLMWHYYTTKKPLPVDTNQLSRIARVTADEINDLEFVITEFFQRKEEKLYSKRIEYEIAEAKERHQKAVKKGAKGAAKRYQS